MTYAITFKHQIRHKSSRKGALEHNTRKQQNLTHLNTNSLRPNLHFKYNLENEKLELIKYNNQQELEQIFTDNFLQEQIQERLNLATSRKLSEAQKNADSNLSELILTANHDYFTKDEKLNNEITNAFIMKSLNFLQTKFGKGLISVHVHLDETTPHIHAFLTPLTLDKKGKYKVSHKEIFGSIYDRKLEKWQDEVGEFYSKESEHGKYKFTEVLKRGERKSAVSPKHKDIKQFRKALVRTKLEQEEIKKQLKDLTIEEQNKKLLEDLVATKYKLKVETDNKKYAENEIRKADYTIKKYYEEKKLQTQRLKQIQLSDVLQNFYGAYLSDKSTKNNPLYIVNNDKILINDKTNNFHSVLSEKNGFGAINLVMYLDNVDFEKAREKLLNFYNTDEISSTAIAYNAEEAKQEYKKLLEEKLRQQEESDKNLLETLNFVEIQDFNSSKVAIHLRDLNFSHATIRYLMDGNILREQRVHGLTNLALADGNGGFEISGTMKQSQHYGKYKRNSNKFFHLDNDSKKLIIAESVKDALAFLEVKGLKVKDYDIISTSGNANINKIIESKNLELYHEIITAFDNDEDGAKFTKKIQNSLENWQTLSINIPENKDFLEDLKINNSKLKTAPQKVDEKTKGDYMRKAEELIVHKSRTKTDKELFEEMAEEARKKAQEQKNVTKTNTNIKLKY